MKSSIWLSIPIKEHTCRVMLRLGRECFETFLVDELFSVAAIRDDGGPPLQPFYMRSNKHAYFGHEMGHLIEIA